ncbi:MAG: CoA transferase, partial [Brevundimonas sp.]|nr:CoA transferase [Brevundimonas sp.]
AELTPRLTTDELIARCHAAQIPAQPVRDIGAMLDDPHLAATGFFKQRQHPSEGAYHEISAPIRFGAMPQPERRPPPLLDQDGAAIRAELTRQQD